MLPRALPLLSVLLTLSTALAGGGGEAPTVTLNNPSCHPVIGTVTFRTATDPAASRRLAQLFAQDQADRAVQPIDWSKVAPADQARRREALQLLNAGRLSQGEDFYHAAFLFQHGDCPQHYELANLLAQQAMRRGYPAAGWLYAATFDRWMLSLGRPQKYGTQFVTEPEGCVVKLAPYDPATTDAERTRLGAPALAVALRQADKLSALCNARQSNGP